MAFRSIRRGPKSGRRLTLTRGPGQAFVKSIAPLCRGPGEADIPVGTSPRSPQPVVSTILPMCSPDSISVWASAAAVSGKREWMRGRCSCPDSKSGQTFSLTA